MMMHLSHNIRHLLEEGAGIIPVISDLWLWVGIYSGLRIYALHRSSTITIFSLIQWLLMLIGVGFSVSVGRMFQNGCSWK